MSKTLKELIHNTVFINYKKYNKLEKDNDTMNISNFLKLLKQDCITNSDGFGYLVYRNRVLKDSVLFLMCGDAELIHFNFNKYNLRLKTLFEIFKDEVAILWINR